RRLGIAAGEVDGATVAGGRVAEGVQGRHRDREGGAGCGTGRGTEGEVGGGSGSDGDGAALAGACDGVGVRGGQRLVASGLERGAATPTPSPYTTLFRPRRLGIAAGEVDGATVAGGRVAEGVQGRDRDREGRPRRGTGRGIEGEVGGGS